MKDHYDSREEEIADMLYEQGFTDREGNPIPDPYAPVNARIGSRVSGIRSECTGRFSDRFAVCFQARRRVDRTARQESKPATARLFGDLWLAGELCIMFADTAKGKSILATQIAESIARGVPIGPLEMTAPPQRVLYLDFELSAEQFRERYSNNGSRSVPIFRTRDADRDRPDQRAARRIQGFSGISRRFAVPCVRQPPVRRRHCRQHLVSDDLDSRVKCRAPADARAQTLQINVRPLDPRPRPHAKTLDRPRPDRQRPAGKQDARQFRRQHLRHRPQLPRPRHPLHQTHQTPQHRPKIRRLERPRLRDRKTLHKPAPELQKPARQQGRKRTASGRPPLQKPA